MPFSENDTCSCLRIIRIFRVPSRVEPVEASRVVSELEDCWDQSLGQVITRWQNLEADVLFRCDYATHLYNWVCPSVCLTPIRKIVEIASFTCKSSQPPVVASIGRVLFFPFIILPSLPRTAPGHITTRDVEATKALPLLWVK